MRKNLKPCSYVDPASALCDLPKPRSACGLFPRSYTVECLAEAMECEEEEKLTDDEAQVLSVCICAHVCVREKL